MNNFRSYQLSVKLYKEIKSLDLRGSVKDQITRASLSVSLNLAEGNDRQTTKDRKRFFNIALTSLREVQAVIDLEDLNSISKLSDQLGAALYCLQKNCY